MKRPSRVLLSAIVLVVLAVAVSAYYYETKILGPARGQITLRTSEFFFIGENGVLNPNLKVDVSDHVTITLRNQGGREHKLMVIHADDFQRFVDAWVRGERPPEPAPAFEGAKIEGVPPGEARSASFVADKPGAYVYACFERVPDLHAHLGMRGNFLVGQTGALRTGPIGYVPPTSLFAASLAFAARSGKLMSRPAPVSGIVLSLTIL